MRGRAILLTACLLGLCMPAAEAASQLELSVVEWDIPGIPDNPAVVQRLDGREIRARAGERVYISSDAGRVAANSGRPDTLAVAPPARAPLARPDRAYPRTKVTIPGYAPRGGFSSPAVESARAYAAIDGGGALPRAFTFEPDYSPVILTGVTSPGGRMPVRNANIYRRYDGGRAAAEVIETVTPDAPPDPDNLIMAPPGGGGLPRAEVVLPSSARGIGNGREYGSGR